MIRHFLLGAALVTMTSAANATDYEVSLLQTGDTWTGGFVSAGITGAFTDTITFSDVPASIADVGMLHYGLGINAIQFTSFVFDGVDYIANYGSAEPGRNTLSVFNVPVGAGKHVLTVTGVSNGNATYSGAVNFNAVPVPAPASWSVMVAGILGVGFAMRARGRALRTA